ncbi:hypothetical protein CEXT_693521 [Caerostris extrusa]|uniref:Uncharacterized protein n=1 Tax=Caerostris extrusa TaxID=172846 RepID=A0AAV4N2W8_CAEEX|nr:hypothetical protein CEXT_693521 [Caerostris extrusa]
MQPGRHVVGPQSLGVPAGQFWGPEGNRISHDTPLLGVNLVVQAHCHHLSTGWSLRVIKLCRNGEVVKNEPKAAATATADVIVLKASSIKACCNTYDLGTRRK